MDRWNDELYHHGVLGMRWGVRNAGTKARYKAEKAYAKQDPKKLSKVLKKQVRKKRGESNGSANRWAAMSPIGENSKSLIEKRAKLQKEYENSKEYKKWKKSLDLIDKKVENSLNKGIYTIDGKDFDDWHREQYDKMLSKKPKPNFNVLYGARNPFSGNGQGWINDYAKKGGLDLGKAYLKDLNYSDDQIKRFTKFLSRHNYVVGE